MPDEGFLQIGQGTSGAEELERQFRLQTREKITIKADVLDRGVNLQRFNQLGHIAGVGFWNLSQSQIDEFGIVVLDAFDVGHGCGNQNKKGTLQLGKTDSRMMISMGPRNDVSTEWSMDLCAIINDQIVGRGIVIGAVLMKGHKLKLGG